MKKVLSFALLSTFVATSAFAGDTGGYVSADLGAATLENAPTFSNPGVFSFGGGYRFSPNIAAELGVTIFGDSTSYYYVDTLYLSSFHPAAVGILPVNDQFGIFGKLGLAMNSEKLSNYYYGSRTSYSQTSMYYALGAQYNFNRQVGMRVQYESFGDFDNFPQPISATVVSLGVAYYF